MVSPIKKILASKIVWYLTGITYPTAIIATHGKYLPKDKYVIAGQEEMSTLFSYIGLGKTILEFGCGPGKNLFGIADRIKSGYGIDINPLYIRLAKTLSKRYRLKNLHFLKYDGYTFPDIPTVDMIFEKGVFERLEKPLVHIYVEKLSKYLNKGGLIILYFLMAKARGTEFTRKLGDSAYFYWNHDEVVYLLEMKNLAIREVICGMYADFYVCELRR